MTLGELLTPHGWRQADVVRATGFAPPVVWAHWHGAVPRARLMAVYRRTVGVPPSFWLDGTVPDWWRPSPKSGRREAV